MTTTSTPASPAAAAAEFQLDLGTLNAILQMSETERPPSKLQAAKVMLVDDEPINLDVVAAYLDEAGYTNVFTTDDSASALTAMRRELPQVVLLDLRMPDVNGFEILDAARKDPELHHIPIIILTASTDAEHKLKALELGATDFLGKPVDASELVLRLRNTLAAKVYQDRLQQYSAELEAEVRRRTLELEYARHEAIHCLARAAEIRDDDTGHHVLRVGRYAGIIARKFGFDDIYVETIELAAQLHDVGKIGVSDRILLKPGKLSDAELEQVKRHCEFGARIMQPSPIGVFEAMGLGQNRFCSPIMNMAHTIAATHHERWDGTGYPRGLRGEAIPIEGRITAVADVFDALSSERPYKEAFSHGSVLKVLEAGRGTHFDPRVLDAFLDGLDEIRDVEEFLMQPSSSPDDASVAACGNRPDHTPSLAGKRILLVDDETTTVAVLGAILQDAGCKSILTTTEPQNVVEIAETERPDLLLLDLHMPGKSGFDVLRHLRSVEGVRETPVIVVTAVPPMGLDRRLKELGVIEVVTKPIDASWLLDAVERALAGPGGDS